MHSAGLCLALAIYVWLAPAMCVRRQATSCTAPTMFARRLLCLHGLCGREQRVLSFIYIPLHAARRAMHGSGGLLQISSSRPRPASPILVGLPYLLTPLIHLTREIIDEVGEKRKERTKGTHSRMSPARPLRPVCPRCPPHKSHPLGAFSSWPYTQP